jgi:orotidine-5'-phosphate decarboxylase
MNQQQLFQQIQKKRSFLCVGLDTDILKIPKHLLDTSDPVFFFNKEIIDATAEFAVAYKPNLAFYESLGGKVGRASKKQFITFAKITRKFS